MVRRIFLKALGSVPSSPSACVTCSSIALTLAPTIFTKACRHNRILLKKRLKNSECVQFLRFFLHDIKPFQKSLSFILTSIRDCMRGLQSVCRWKKCALQKWSIPINHAESILPLTSNLSILLYICLISSDFCWIWGRFSFTICEVSLRICWI